MYGGFEHVTFMDINLKETGCRLRFVIRWDQKKLKLFSRRAVRQCWMQRCRHTEVISTSPMKMRKECGKISGNYNVRKIQQSTYKKWHDNVEICRATPAITRKMSVTRSPSVKTNSCKFRSGSNTEVLKQSVNSLRNPQKTIPQTALLVDECCR